MQIGELRKILSVYDDEQEILFEDYSDITITEVDGEVFVTTLYGRD